MPPLSFAVPSRIRADSSPLTRRNPWLLLILFAGPTLGLVGGLLGIVTSPSLVPAYPFTAVLLPAVAVALFGLGLREPRLLPLAAIVLGVEALLAAATLPAGLVLAMVLPMVGLILMQDVLSARQLLWSTVVTGGVATVGVALAVLVGPARVLFAGASPAITIGSLIALGMFALALNWRAVNHLRGALDTAEDGLAARRAAERELARTSELLARIVDSSPLATQAFGMDRRVTVWNKASERIFGWTADEVIGHPMPEAMVPEDERETSAERIR
ncbi:MAG TPA: PAS domain S-box protein, partial [Candidatus Limnocylindrales bacterium]